MDRSLMTIDPSGLVLHVRIMEYNEGSMQAGID